MNQHEHGQAVSHEKLQGYSELKGADRKHESADASPEQKAEQLDTIRQALQEIAPPKERLALPVDDKPQDNQPLYIDRTVKALRLKESLKEVRRSLSAPDRALSKVIHQPAVKAVSEVSGKTLARPSGLLGGGLLAFTGSLAYLVLTKYVGMPYNYLFSTMFFVGGFILGIALEFALKLSRGRASS